MSKMNKQRKRDTEQVILATLKKMHQLIYTADTSKVISDVKGKDIVLFLGNTRCGKSTIVNYVIGNNLVANRIRGKLYNITKQDQNSPGPVIGVGSTSETTIPTAWPSNKISGVIVDAPGFDDNRGESQDVANAFYVKEIINNAKSVKFVLISDIIDITSDNIGHFTNFVDKILTMLPHNGNLHKGMVMLFTKDRDGYTKQDVRDIFQEKIMHQHDMKIKNRQLVDYLHRNLNQIVIVKMPNAPGPIAGPEVFDTLLQTIESNVSSISKNEMSSVIPGISDRSRGFLLEAHRYFTELSEFDDVLKIAYNEFSKNLTEFDVAQNTGSTASTMALKNKLVALEDRVKNIRNSQEPLFTKLAQLGELVPAVQQLKENSEIHLKLKFVNFVDDVLKIKESNIFDVKIHATMSHMLDRASQARIILQEKMMEISQQEANARIQEIVDNHKNSSDLLAQQINELREQNRQLIEAQKNQKKGLFGKIGGWLDKVF